MEADGQEILLRFDRMTHTLQAAPVGSHELIRTPDGSDAAGDGDVSVSIYRVDPAEFGLARATMDELRGGDASVNAEAIRRVVGGDHSAHRDIAVLNAAAALTVVGRVADLAAGVTLAASLIDDGSAARVLDEFVRVTCEASASGSATTL